MAGLNRMTGTVWHIERFERAEGDERRHRSRCVNYQGKKGFCNFYGERCRGSAHCMMYKEKDVEVQKEVKGFAKKKYTSGVSSFDGIKQIKISDITVGKRLIEKPHNDEKVNKIIEYFKIHGELDKPIVVNIVDGTYRIQKKYSRFLAAKKLGLITIPAEMGTKEEIKERKALRKIGTLVWQQKYGEVGEVIKATISHVTLKNDDGKERIYNIDLALKNKSIRVIG